MNSDAGRNSAAPNISDDQLHDTNGLACPLRRLEWNDAAILDACTVRADYGHLLALTRDGALHGIDLDTGVSARLCRVDLPDIPPGRDNGHFGPAKYRLHASQDGKHAAVVVDRGRKGVVLGIPSGEVSMHLDGGDYCDETVPFSACFLRPEGRDVFIHRTAWNRLDAADPSTGDSLASRDITPYVAGGERPAHYLDYFHGQLRPSPDGSHIFDDGWVWHPISVPRVWSVTKWLGSNPWESEDGASVVNLAMREDWTKPICWIDERRLALWGLAGWDEEELAEVTQGPGVRIIDVIERNPLPDVWPMDSQSQPVLDLFSDGARLYVADDTGTTAWDLSLRAKLSRFPGFTASLLDQARNTLVAYSDSAIRELRLPWQVGNHGRR